jgi:hypothetical protein
MEDEEGSHSCGKEGRKRRRRRPLFILPNHPLFICKVEDSTTNASEAGDCLGHHSRIRYSIDYICAAATAAASFCTVS